MGVASDYDTVPSSGIKGVEACWTFWKMINLGEVMGGWISANSFTQWKQHSYTNDIRIPQDHSSRRNSDQTEFLKVAGKWFCLFWSKDIPKYVEIGPCLNTWFHSGDFEGEMPVPFSQKKNMNKLFTHCEPVFWQPSMYRMFFGASPPAAMDARSHGLLKVIKWYQVINSS